MATVTSLVARYIHFLTVFSNRIAAYLPCVEPEGWKFGTLVSFVFCVCCVCFSAFLLRERKLKKYD